MSLGAKGTLVISPEIEKFVSGAHLNRMKTTKNLINDKRVAVIGVSPVGMTLLLRL